jgi:hypothetical protein
MAMKRKVVASFTHKEVFLSKLGDNIDPLVDMNKILPN